MASERKAGVVLGYANIVIKNLVNLIYTPMLLAFIGQAGYGVYQTSYSFVFALTLLSFGFSEAYVRFYTQTKIKGTENDVAKLNGMYLILYLAVCFLVLCLGLVFSANAGVLFSVSFSSEQLLLAEQLMAIMTINIAVTLFSTVFDAYILANERFRFQQSRQLFTTLAAPGIAFLLLYIGMGAVGVAVAQLSVSLILLFLNARFAIKKAGMSFLFKDLDWTIFRAIAAFSAWIFANQLCELVNQSVPNILLGAFCGASIVAVFAVSLQIRSIFYSLSTTMSTVFVPMINRIVAETDDNQELTRLMTKVGRYQAILYTWVYGGFVVLGEFFVSKWAGNSFTDAYYLVLIMAAPLVIPLIQNTGIEIQRAKNRHKTRSVAYFLMALVNVSLTVILSPTFGYWAPAIGYVTYVVFGCGLFMNWYYHRKIGIDIKYFWRKIAPIFLIFLLCTIACYLGTILFPVDNWFVFIAWGMIYTTIFMALIFGFCMDANERKTITSRLKIKKPISN